MTEPRLVLDAAAAAPGYRLWRTRVHVSTIRRVTAEKPGLKPLKVVFATKVETVPLADPLETSRYPLSQGRSVAEEREVAVTLTEDERLTSLSTTSSGIGPELIAAGARLVGTVVGAAVAAAAGRPPVSIPGLGFAPPSPDASEDEKRKAAEKAVGDLKEVEGNLKGTIAEGEGKLITASKSALQEPANVTHFAEANRIERELARLRRLLELVEARIEELEIANQETWDEADEGFYFLESLPEPPLAASSLTGPGLSIALTEFIGGGGETATTVRDMLVRFGVLICCRDAEDPKEETQPPVDAVVKGSLELVRKQGIPQGWSAELEPALMTRVPRAVDIAVFAPLRPEDLQTYISSPGASLDLKLVSRTRQLVVDQRSRIVAVPLAGAGLFGKEALVAKLGSLGGIIDLSTKEATTAPGAVISGLSGLEEGISSAKTMAEQLGNLSDFRTQQQLNALKSRKEFSELSKALGLTGETEAERAEKERSQRKSELELTRLQLEVEELRMKLEAGLKGP